MKSVKPGRGPSMMGGIVGIGVALFGVLWTFVAFKMGGGIFALFGVFFVFVAIAMVIYNFKNATSKNRFSSFDITSGEEEPDPLNERYGEGDSSYSEYPASASGEGFCPYCGEKAEAGFEFCRKCGKRLPD